MSNGKKIERFLDEIDRNEEKIRELKAKNVLLNEEVKKMQNDDIIQAIRSKKIDARELQTIIMSIADLVDLKRNEANTEMVTSGQNVQKQEETTSGQNVQKFEGGMEDEI